MQDINVYTEAVRLFAAADPGEMAAKAGAVYEEPAKVINLKYLGYDVTVKHPSGKMQWALQETTAINDRVLILQYLQQSCGVPPRGNWISFMQLPDGPHHHAPFVAEAVKPLADIFGLGRHNLDMFKARTTKFSANLIDMGDCGVLIPVFPKLPLAVCIWTGDDEFEANANILFDSTAPLHLTTAALWVMGVEVSRKLRNTDGQQYIQTVLSRK